MEMSNMSNIEIAQEISTRIGNEPIPFESVYSVAFDIYQELGGTAESFDDVYSILLQRLPLAENITYEAGTNIYIDSSNTISALGYIYNEGLNSLYEGDTAKVYGSYSHAEGYCSEAGTSRDYNDITPAANIDKNYTHAEGNATAAKGSASHTEGKQTFTEGVASHAEGYITIARGIASHAEGEGTIARNYTSHAEGRFNVSHKVSNTLGESGNTQHSIGIGTGSENRKNALEVMQNGDMYVLGIGNYDGVHIKTETGYENTKTVQEYITTLETTISSLEARITALENGNN